MQVCMGAMMQCSFGVAPSSLAVLPVNRTLTGTPAANIMDNKPIVNIPPFGMCTSVANPMVIAATAAALGCPHPCPASRSPWRPWIVGAPKGAGGEHARAEQFSQADVQLGRRDPDPRSGAIYRDYAVNH